MLIPLEARDFDRWAGYAYALALDLTRSGYPTYADGIKTKADFLSRARKALSRDDEGILLFQREGRTAGWIHYYHLPEDQYLDTCSFCIEEGTGQALEEFIAFAKKRFPGSQLHLGFPAENREAVEALGRCGFPRIERSFNDVLSLERWTLRPACLDVVPVTRENYELFRALHAQDEDMYWNSDRLLAHLDQWSLYLYQPGGEPRGAIMLTHVNESMSEIFGLFFAEGYDGEAYRLLVTAALNEARGKGVKNMVFFNDQESQADALALGFRCVSEYVCYRVPL